MPQVWHMDSKGPSIPNSGAVTLSAWAGISIKTETETAKSLFKLLNYAAKYKHAINDLEHGTFYNVSKSYHPIVTFISVDRLKWINDFVFLVLQ